MTRRELDHLLEQAVADALGVPLPDSHAARRAKRSKAERGSRRQAAAKSRERELEPA